MERKAVVMKSKKGLSPSKPVRSCDLLNVTPSELRNSALDLVHQQLELFSTKYSNNHLAGEQNGRYSKDTDSSFAWLIALSCGILQIVAVIQMTIAGMFYLEFVEAFDKNKNAILWVVNIQLSFVYGMGPVAAILTDKTSARVSCMVGCLGVGCFLMIGLLTNTFAIFCVSYAFTGIFSALIFIPSCTYSVRYFKKYRVMALGLASSCIPVSEAITPVWITYLIQSDGWRVAVLFISLLSLQGTVLAGLLREPRWKVPKNMKYNVNHASHDTITLERKKFDVLFPSEDSLNVDEIDNNNKILQRSQLQEAEYEKLTEKSSAEYKFSEMISAEIVSENPTILHWRVFVTLAFCFIWGWSSSSFYVLLPDYAFQFSLSPQQISYVYVVGSACDFITRLIVAGLGQIWMFSKVLTVSVAMMGMAAATFGLTLATSFPGFAMLMGVYKSGYGVLGCLESAVILEMHGEYKIEMIFGLQMLCYGLGSMASAPFAALFKDQTTGFYIASSLLIIGTLLYLPHVLIRFFQKTRLTNRVHK